MFEFIQASWVDNRTVIFYTLTNEQGRSLLA
jgi:hypothetical protein